jgi:hypothetical protein
MNESQGPSVAATIPIIVFPLGQEIHSLVRSGTARRLFGHEMVCFLLCRGLTSGLRFHIAQGEGYVQKRMGCHSVARLDRVRHAQYPKS